MPKLSAEDDFERQLEVFQSECDELVRFFYAGHALTTSALEGPTILRALNRSPLFWSTVIGGLNTAVVVTLGRIFDPRSDNYSVNRLLALAHSNLDIFSEHRARARMARAFLPPGAAYVATGDDFRRLKQLVAVRRKQYEVLIRPARIERYAHRSVFSESELKTGPGFVDAATIQKLVTFFPRLHGALWRLYYNGERPVMRPARHSTVNMLRSPADGLSFVSVQERVVRQARDVLNRSV